MSKQKKLVEEEEKEYITIGMFFEEFLENKESRVFPFLFDGSSTAANKKRKHTRISIGIPNEICNTNLKELDKWCLYAVAIPREDVKKVEAKLEKELNDLKEKIGKEVKD